MQTELNSQLIVESANSNGAIIMSSLDFWCLLFFFCFSQIVSYNHAWLLIHSIVVHCMYGQMLCSPSGWWACSGW